MREFTEKDVDKRLEQILARHGRLVPFDGPAAAGRLRRLQPDVQERRGRALFSSKEEVIRIRPVLSFRDGKIEDFDKLMKGVKAGETREATAKLTADAPNESLRGQEITAVFEVLEVKKLELPELTPELLERVGRLRSRKASCATRSRRT